MRDIIIDLQNFDTWEIQLAIAINFISWKDVEEERIMHSKSHNIKFTSYNDVNEVIDKIFESRHPIYHDNLEKSMGGSEFIFNSVQLMH